MDSTRGVSLIEAMIGITILAVGSLIVSQLFIFQAQRQKAVEVRGNYNTIKMSVQSAITDQTAILRSGVKNVPVTATTIPGSSSGTGG